MTEPSEFPVPEAALQRAAAWYSSPRLWKKLGRVVGVAGENLLLAVLTLFHCLKDRETPAWARGVIVGALGYFILPADLIPDVIPGIGYADDWGALVAALGAVAAYIKDDHKARARQQVDRLLRRESQAADVQPHPSGG